MNRSTNFRIRKLERKANSGFSIFAPTLLDFEGSALQRETPKENLRSVRYSNGRTNVLVEREEGEAINSFELRSRQTVIEAHPGSIVLYFWARFI